MPRSAPFAARAAGSPVSTGRRRLLGGAAALPAAAAAAGLLGTTRRAAAIEAPSTPSANAVGVGDFSVATLLAGTRVVPDPHTIFGLDVADEAFAEASREAFLPTDSSRFYFTPTVLEANGETILFDTGLSAEGIVGALADAGLSAGDVDVVVLTHMHGDHVGGLTGEDGSTTFENARYVTGRVEYDAWAKMENETFEAKVRPLAERMSFLEDGDEVASGVTAMAAFGHTPGHMIYRLESNGQGLVLFADTANHYVWSLGYPDWEVKFDMDKAAAAETRRRVLEMLASERLPFVGYHMPFPGMGFVEAGGGDRAYRYVPVSYQFALEG